MSQACEMHLRDGGGATVALVVFSKVTYEIDVQSMNLRNTKSKKTYIPQELDPVRSERLKKAVDIALRPVWLIPIKARAKEAEEDRCSYGGHRKQGRDNSDESHRHWECDQ